MAVDSGEGNQRHKKGAFSHRGEFLGTRNIILDTGCTVLTIRFLVPVASKPCPWRGPRVWPIRYYMGGRLSISSHC